jgi:hypothetical protein
VIGFIAYSNDGRIDERSRANAEYRSQVPPLDKTIENDGLRIITLPERSASFRSRHARHAISIRLIWGGPPELKARFACDHGFPPANARATLATPLSMPVMIVMAQALGSGTRHTS